MTCSRPRNCRTIRRSAHALAWCTRHRAHEHDRHRRQRLRVDGSGRRRRRSAGVGDHALGGATSTELLADGQTRLWWDETPVDVFLDTTPFHVSVGERIRWEPFGDVELPFLACRDLAVFKAFFDRTTAGPCLGDERSGDAGRRRRGRRARPVPRRRRPPCRPPAVARFVSVPRSGRSSTERIAPAGRDDQARVPFRFPAHHAL